MVPTDEAYECMFCAVLLGCILPMHTILTLDKNSFMVARSAARNESSTPLFHLNVQHTFLNPQGVSGGRMMSYPSSFPTYVSELLLLFEEANSSHGNFK